MSFINRLTSITKDYKTSKELAERIGVSPSSITHWRLGQTPRYDTIKKIAEALGVSPGWLAFGESEGRKDK